MLDSSLVFYRMKFLEVGNRLMVVSLKIVLGQKLLASKALMSFVWICFFGQCILAGLVTIFPKSLTFS